MCLQCRHFVPIVFTVFASLIADAASAQENDKEKPAQSKISKVTIYPNHAMVTREVIVPAGNGIADVVVSPLPVRVVDSSLFSEGTAGIRILSTRYRSREVKEDTREEVRKLEQQIKEQQLNTEKIQAEINSIKQNMEMLTKLENFTSATTVHSTEKGGLNSDTVIGLAKYVMEQRMEKSKETVKLQQELKSIQDEISFLQRKLQEISSGSSRVERDAVIVVDRPQGQGGTIYLNYLVDAVSWKPQYKFHADNNDKEVELDYLAEIAQQSGEDWTNAKITLSTAEPRLNAAPPELRELEVAVVERSSVPGMGPGGGKGGEGKDVFSQSGGKLLERAKELRNQAETYSRNQDVRNNIRAINEAAAAEQADELMRSRSELQKIQQSAARQESYSMEGPSVTYQLPTALSVPSRNDAQIIEMTKLKLQASFFYKAIPVLTKNVYRQANLSNKTEYVLLPGEATMYQGENFVGRMRMPLVAIGEEFVVGFGIDPQLQVQRDLLDKTKSTQGGNQVLTYDYRIFVSSYKKDAVTLQVWDRLPKAEVESAAISLVKTTPELSTDPLFEREQKGKNLLRWDLRVEPMQYGKNAIPIRYTFKLELARDKVISELRSR